MADSARESQTESGQQRWRWWRWAALVIFPGYTLLTALTIGLRVEHVVVSLAFIVLAWAGTRSRELSVRCLPFFATAVAYENLPYITPLRGSIHVADLHHADRRWFGVTLASGARVTWSEFFAGHTTAVLDLLCGFAYLAYLYEVFLLAIYFYFRDRKRFTQLAWGFLLVNLLGMATYLIYPAAPPWYAMKYGLGPARLDVPPDPAGTAAFDRLLGISYFQKFYARNANVFGAMPSLHVAYPLLVFCVVASKGLVWSLASSGFAVLVGFSAVYLRHHYVWDVLVGATYAVATYLLLRLVERWRPMPASEGLLQAPPVKRLSNPDYLEGNMSGWIDIISGRLTTQERIVSAAAPAVLILGYFVLGYLVYRLRNAIKGPFVDREIATRGSSLLLNMALRHYFAWVMKPIWALLRVLRLPANAMTTLSVLLAAGAAVAMSAGRFSMGGWLYVFSGLCDFFDGRIARTTGTASPAGAALDSVLDRLSDGLVLVGLSWYYRDSWVLPVIGVALIGSFLVSYIRAKADSLGVQLAKVGMMQRPERVAYLGFAVALSPILAALYVPNDPRPPHYLAIVAIMLIAAGTTWTATIRLIYLLRALGGFRASHYASVDRGSVWRFAVSSVVATAADFVTMLLLVRAYDLAPTHATLLGCAVGGLINFTINRAWVFGHPQPVVTQASRYTLISGTSALLNAGGVAVLLLLPALDYRVAWAVARVSVFLFWNYPLNRDYAFAEPVEARAPDGEASTDSSSLGPQAVGR